jgi:hypothetical protein
MASALDSPTRAASWNIKPIIFEAASKLIIPVGVFSKTVLCR